MPALIRPARITDSPGIAQVYIETWRASYAGLLPEAYLSTLTLESLTFRWCLELSAVEGPRVFVAVEKETIVGFVSGGEQRTRLVGFEAEIYCLYLLPRVQGHGLGRSLLTALAGDLRRRGYRSVLVWVLADNPARRFYEHLGGQPCGEQTILLAKTLLPEIAYGWQEITFLADAAR